MHIVTVLWTFYILDPVTVLQGHAKQLKTRLSGALLRNVGNLAKLVNKGKAARDGVMLHEIMGRGFCHTLCNQTALEVN